MGNSKRSELQAVKIQPISVDAPKPPFRGFLLPVNGLCKTPKVQRNAQRCTEQQKSLPEPCRGFGQQMEGTEKTVEQMGHRSPTMLYRHMDMNRILDGELGDIQERYFNHQRGALGS